MRLCMLASGSSGNSMLLDSGSTKILIDAGISRKAIIKRLAGFGYGFKDINALCLTHNHCDHCDGLKVISKHHNVPLYATEGTCEAVNLSYSVELKWNIFSPGVPFTIGDFEISPFRVPHDAPDPVGFVINDGHCKIGIATDLGETPDMVIWNLRDCDALVLEFNHDKDMLWESDRPWELKNRISQRKGHLSNEQAGYLLEKVASPRLRDVFLAHVSNECNTVELAVESAREALERSRCGKLARVHLAGPDPIGIFEIGKAADELVS